MTATSSRYLALAIVLGLPIAIAANVVAQTAVPQSQRQIQYSFAPLVKATGPAVVNVYARTKVQERGFSPFADDPFFRRFFGDDAFGLPREQVQNALGSGVIVDPSGVIVTNNHVVQGASDVRVGLPDRREFDAKVLLADNRTDLAVLKIDAHGQKLPIITFGDSDSLEVGDLVLAIGNPFGVGQTVTSGIVSALARTEVGISDYQFFIQTDAAINPGNSGGALVDMSGHLVGVNTAIFSRSGGSIGIGFAIPVNMVKVVVHSAETGGKIVRPWLGAELQDVTVEIAQSLGLSRPQGVLIASVDVTSALARAGLQQGDLLLAIDGRDVNSAKEVVFRIATMDVGSEAALHYRRDKKDGTVHVVLTPAPETTPRQETVLKGNNPLSGLVVANLSPAVAEELGLSSGLVGVVVTNVQDGPGSRFGFEKGDIIVRVNGTDIDGVQTLTQILKGAGSSWDLAVNRNGQLLSLRLRG